MKHLFLFVVLSLSFAAGAAAQRPTPTPIEPPFLMAVEDAFYISGRGVVATGSVERGRIKVGDAVELVGLNPTKPATVAAIEAFRQPLAEAKAGDNIGLLLRGVEKADVERGTVIAKPASIKPYTKLKAKIDLKTAAEGGRSRPLPNESRMLIEFRGKGVSGTIIYPAGTTVLQSGAKGIDVDIVLERPVAAEKGQIFAVLEGGRTIGAGTITLMTPEK